MSGARFLEIVAVGLAAYRLARLVALDTITDPARAWLYRHAFTPPAYDDPPTVRNRAWAWVYDLVSCVFCVSVWVSLGLWFAFVPTVSWRNLLWAGAVAGTASILAAVDTR